MKLVVYAALAAMCLSLSACNTSPGMGEALMSKQERDRKDNTICQSYGAKPGTELFIQCRMKQDEIRAANRRSLMSDGTTCFASGATLICN